jgi:hypothetical protein
MIRSELEQLNKEIVKHRRLGHRIRRILLKLRARESLYGWGDLMILNTIVNCLKESNEPYSRSEIYSAFRVVNRDDYDSGDKNTLIKGLLRGANNRSAFGNRLLIKQTNNRDGS